MTPDEFRWLAEGEQRMPCHLHMKDGVDYAHPGDAPQCAGRAIYWANQLKVPRSEGVLLTLPPNTVTVFQWPHEFLTHHKSGLLTEEKKK